MSNNKLPPINPEPSQASNVLGFDADKYLEHIEDCDLTEPQKAEFLHTLWNIMATFVRLGFDVEYTLPILFQKASENGGNALEQAIPTHEFNISADDTVEDDEEIT
ncbi:hypothetical protein [Eoetvoesiella caeni]|uniref:Uncharacterized protein n=1 Tax=Eoetvoesiella caeni TaxID=645616 RepID=A0A366HCJ0_9BURK|nr:hypothetical protein [Eoetvoesiella caeni]MCI2808926.1 hypothetical protein [Eoetvoesiella caeni]NYT55573.1 hypothetical protein [Eoetvoesiella caeni]RBP40128.1 hypothetical protein DFR37_104225 [Eoetvoesiella caeni]